MSISTKIYNHQDQAQTSKFKHILVSLLHTGSQEL